MKARIGKGLGLFHRSKGSGEHLLTIAADFDRLVFIEGISQVHGVVEREIINRLPLHFEAAAPRASPANSIRPYVHGLSRQR